MAENAHTLKFGASQTMARTMVQSSRARLASYAGSAVVAVVALLSAPDPWRFVVAALLLALVVQTAGIGRSAARLRLQAQESERAALHDPVTELPNRVLFHARAHQAVALARRSNTQAALLLLDLDRFKEINDTLGHHNGDLLLHAVGRRLAGLVREADCVARLGGDEFAILLGTVDGEEGALVAADRVREAVSRRVELEGLGVEVEASVGVVVHPADGTDIDTLLQRADIAMYIAKRDHTGICRYTPELDANSREKLGIVADLRRGLDADELVLHFQPKADLASGAVCGVEALVRWQHPEKGLVFPDAFIPLAENTGLIRPLTLRVLDLALRQSRAWAEAGIELTVAVNVSTRNLLDLTLPEELEALLERHDVPASRLELEITETAFMTDPVRAKEVLERLGALGLSLAIDDFGTGYTSLSWLRDLPVSTIKVDRSFVMQMIQEAGDAQIVRSTVQLGRSLGLAVVAEGVEDEAAWAELTELGCHFAQGYFLSRPQPVAMLDPWLAERSGASSERTAASTSATGGLSAELSA